MSATVPKRCRSIAAGSAISGSRCITMPTCRCSRTACWAAAIERGRPIVTGSTMPGNRTILRTGTMMSASPGTGAIAAAPLAGAAACATSGSATDGSNLLQRDQEATVGRGAAHRAVAARRQPHATLEAALRQLEAVDDGGLQLLRQHAGSREHQVIILDRGLDLIGIDPRQGNDDEHFE